MQKPDRDRYRAKNPTCQALVVALWRRRTRDGFVTVNNVVFFIDPKSFAIKYLMSDGDKYQLTRLASLLL